MDIDSYVAAHKTEWDRLDTLIRKAARPRRLSGVEADELVGLYQRSATHLSVVQAGSPDPMLLDRLSALVGRARSAVTGARDPGWREVGRFAQVTFPAGVYRQRWWILGTAAAFLLVTTGIGWWIAIHPAVQNALAPPEVVRQLVTHDFASYYSSAPAGSFAAKVWTNNAWITAGAITFGVLLGLPTIYLLLQNALNLAIAGGILIGNGQAAQFFGLILPHGLLELSAVFIAGGVGLRVGWSIIDPGPTRSRGAALAAEGRAAVGVAIGLVAVLAVSGALEAFVTPSGLPTWARVGIGVTVELLFLAYLWRFGRRATVAGETGDLELTLGGDAVPTS